MLEGLLTCISHDCGPGGAKPPLLLEGFRMVGAWEYKLETQDSRQLSRKTPPAWMDQSQLLPGKLQC